MSRKGHYLSAIPAFLMLFFWLAMMLIIVVAVVLAIAGAL